MKKKAKKYKYFVEVCESEYAVIAFPNGLTLLDHIETNGADKCGTVEVPKSTHKRLQKGFKEGYCAIGLSWKKYAPEFGYKEA